MVALYSRYIFLLLLLCFSSIARSQQFEIKGIIKDEDGKPVNKTGIRIKDEKLITLTNEKGEFRFKCTKLPIEIVISHLGYVTTVFKIDDTLSHIYTLPTKDFQLEEVVITPGKTFFGEKHDTLNYISFEVTDEHIVALGVKRYLPRNKYLLLFDLNGNLLNQQRLKQNVRALYKSCTRDIFLLSNDSAYQMYYDNEFTLLYPVSIPYFKKVMEPCITIHHDTMYIRTSRFMNLVNDYYYADINSVSPRVEKFLTVEDSSNTYDLRSKYSITYFLKRRSSDGRYQYPVDTLMKYQDLFIEQSITNEADRAQYLPLNTQFIVCNDNLHLVDLRNENILTLNKKMKPEKQLRLKSYRKLTMKEHLLFSDHCSELFLTHQSNGKLVLDKININTGKITSFKTIENYPHLKNMRLLNNTLFFLYKETGNDGEYKIHFYPLN